MCRGAFLTKVSERAGPSIAVLSKSKGGKWRRKEKTEKRGVREGKTEQRREEKAERRVKIGRYVGRIGA